MFTAALLISCAFELPDSPTDSSDSAAEAPAEACDGDDNDGDGLIDEGFDLDNDGRLRL